MNWNVVAGSGAAPCTPGDVIGEKWLGECKTHTSSSKSIYFNHDVWEKIKSESVMKHRLPVLFTDDGSQKLDNTWCVCLSSSVEKTGVYVVPLSLTIRKNISFSHQDLIADYRRSRRIMPDIFRELSLVYSCTWCGEGVYLMPFSSFQKIVEEQG